MVEHARRYLSFKSGFVALCGAPRLVLPTGRHRIPLGCCARAHTYVPVNLTVHVDRKLRVVRDSLPRHEVHWDRRIPLSLPCPSAARYLVVSQGRVAVSEFDDDGVVVRDIQVTRAWGALVITHGSCRPDGREGRPPVSCYARRAWVELVRMARWCNSTKWVSQDGTFGFRPVSARKIEVPGAYDRSPLTTITGSVPSWDVLHRSRAPATWDSLPSVTIERMRT